MTGETTTLNLEKIMTKTTKIALGLSLLLIAFKGEGHTQTYPMVIQQQCAANCITTFAQSLAPCASKPASCLQPAVDALNTCMTQTFTPCETCAAPPPGKTLSNYIVQQDAVNCFNTFNAPTTGFPACTTFSCVTALLTTLTQCITGISGSGSCTPPESKR